MEGNYNFKEGHSNFKKGRSNFKKGRSDRDRWADAAAITLVSHSQTQPQLRGSTDRFWPFQLRFLGQNLLDQPVDHSNKSNLTSQSQNTLS